MDPLSILAEKHRTDKGLWHHGYTPTYHKYLAPLKDQPLILLEIGIGGYEYPDRGGESLRMWAEYFTHATIFGIDICPKKISLPGNVYLFEGSQVDAAFLKQIATHIDPQRPNIIIDDGSHINSHTITTFSLLFPHLAMGGIYVVEDTETSYWEENYGGSQDPHAATAMNYFKRLCDSLNDGVSGMANVYGISSIHFYKGLIFIFKS
jgi:hypothetical protein